MAGNRRGRQHAAMGTLQFRRQRIEQRLRQGLGQLQAGCFLIGRLGLAANQQPHALAHGVAGIDRLLRPQGGVEQRIEDLGRRPAGFLPLEFAQQVRCPPQAAAAGGVAIEGIEPPPAGWCGCARTPRRDAGRSSAPSDRAAARECRRAPRDARDCRAPRRAARCRRRGSCPTPRRSAAAAGLRVHVSLAIGDRLLALEHLPDQRMRLGLRAANARRAATVPSCAQHGADAVAHAPAARGSHSA